MYEQNQWALFAFSPPKKQLHDAMAATKNVKKTKLSVKTRIDSHCLANIFLHANFK